MQYTAHDLDVLTRTILGEAMGESDAGQYAVAWTILNRLADPRWPLFSNENSIAAVAQDRKPGSKYGQFSAWNPTDAGGNTLVSRYGPETPEYQRAQRNALAVLNGQVADLTEGAVYYYTPRGMKDGKAPSWWAQSESERGTGYTQIGTHKFSGRVKGYQGPTGSRAVDVNNYTPTPYSTGAQPPQPTQQAAAVPSSAAPATSPRPFVKPPLISPGTPGTYVPPDRSSPHGFAKHDLIIYGGKNGDKFYHPYEYKAHDLNHADYSQHFRDWRLFDSPDQIPAGFVDTGVKRDGKIVAANGRPEYLNGKPVSKDDFIREARARGGIIPRYNEMQALYSRIPGVNMPTSNLWGDKVGGVGTPDQYNQYLNPRLEKAGIGPNDPYYAGKEFYLSDNAAHTESWDVTGTGGTPPVYGESPGPAGPVSHPAPTQAEEDAGIIDKAMEVGKDMWGRLTDSLGLGDAEGVPEPIDSPEAPPSGGAPQSFDGTAKHRMVQDVGVPTKEAQSGNLLWADQTETVTTTEPMPIPPVPEVAPQLPPQVQTTPPPVATSAPVAPVPQGTYVTQSSVPYSGGDYTPPPPVTTESLPPPPSPTESGGLGGSNFLAGIGGDLLKMGLSGLMGGGGGMPLPPAPVVQAPPPPQIATGPVMFNIRKKKDKDKA